ncbi:hypothetical protein MT1_1192 [Pseudomonas sp. MT-1]|nr:hypothetical protein MT1_1192 [Pseudomonas sp. MT-1]
MHLNSMNSRNENIIAHYKGFFEGHDSMILTWGIGPITEVVPTFQVIRFSPGSKINLWVYCSIGASTIKHSGSGMHEFVVASPYPSDRLVEMLAMITYYHSNHNLGFGHTLPIGEPWLERSECKNWLISLPYPFGEELEIMSIDHTHAHVAWLLPISDKERDYKMQNGLEALEQRFDDTALEYWDINRKSAV